MFERIVIRIVLMAFLGTSIGPLPDASAQDAFLPAPGTMVPTSISFKPLQLKGILVNIKNPLRFDFLVDKGYSGLSGQDLKEEIIRSTKYFLTCLAVPEDDLWVNLSPYEKDRIVPDNFGLTLMGRDLLAQDYLLKQIMASLSYPENNLGKRFWQRVYKKAYELYGTTEIPINTFNKVWILPKTAEVYAQGNSAFVVNSQLDVMLEADYKALDHHHGLSQNAGAYSQVFRDVILPQLRQEVNEGKNFAIVRQVYNAMILATWYKRHLRDSLLGRMYVGRNQVNGVDIADKNAKEKIFQQYLKAYKKCVYNYIKEDYNPFTQQTVPHKYASGGMYFAGGLKSVYKEEPNVSGMDIGTDLAMATVDVTAKNSYGTIVSFPDPREITDTHPFHQVPFEAHDTLTDSAMVAGLRKFIKNWMIGVIFAVAVGAVSPSVAKGATFTPGNDGKIIMQVENGDQLGRAMEKIRVTYKKLSPQEYKASVYAGPLYAALNKVVDVQVNNRIKQGDTIRFTESVPQNVLEALSGPVAQAVRSDIVSPKSHVQEPVVLPSQTPLAQSSGGSPGGPPPVDKYGFLLGEIGLAFAAILAVGGGLKLRGYTFSGWLRKAKAGSSPVPMQISGNSLPPVSHDLLNGSVLIDTALPPPAASAEEQKVLAESLDSLRRNVADGDIALSPAVPAEEDQMTGQGGGQNLRWMDTGALLGGLGLSWWLDGGISWMVAASPFIARGLYTAQKWLHEMLHLAPAVVLYPQNSGNALSAGNLKGNLSFWQWAKSFIPLTRTDRSYVDLPFAKAENGWARNKIIGWAGFSGSAALALLAGYWIGWNHFLVPLALSALAVLKGSFDSGDLSGSQDTNDGKFGCGIIGFVKRVTVQGINKKEVRPWLTWFFGSMDSLTVRGGQQAGVATDLIGANGDFTSIEEKRTKEKRHWLFWTTWDRGPVFYRNMIEDLHERFYKSLPRRLVPVYNYAKSGVLKILGHVRFATGGALFLKAAHPHSSPEKKREVWVYDALQNKFKKVIRSFQVTSAFNGDHDSSKIGIPYRKHLKERALEFTQMRRIYPVLVHMYYEGRVTSGYLNKTVSDGRQEGQEVTTNYAAVLRALRKKNYISFGGYVNPRFAGVDEEFKSWFPEYRQQIFNQIESALFGMPPGDAPILPLEQDLDETQGSWWASVRYAHVMANHHDLKEASSDILFEKEGRAIGRVFSEVYDQVHPYLYRPGYIPQNDTPKSLNDLFVKDEETAKKLGLEDQYLMLGILKDMLSQKMQAEAAQNTLAGEVFRQWEKKWESQGINVAHARQVFINAAVEKFFTADGVSAVKEFAESSDGTYGLFMSSSLNDSVTLYQDNQDIVIGLNEQEGVFAFASDPRALKSIGPDGKKVDKVMHLKDGEVVNLSFLPSGKVAVRSWMRRGGEWREAPQEELEKRFYPTDEYVDGIKNPYYAPPPVEYHNPRTIVQEDQQNIPKVLANAQAEWEDTGSFNARSTDYLAQRISSAVEKKGKARLVVIGYDNSRKLSEQFREIAGSLIARSKLKVMVIDSNKFNDSPSKFNIKPDDIVLIVSKSGATFSSKLALRVVQTLVNPENIFCMGARIDSVLNTVIGQGLRPGDPFTKRIFVTGDFYPAETPVVSEVLLMFQLQQLAVNLARRLALRHLNGLLFSAEKIEVLAQRISESSITMAQELTGFDQYGRKYVFADNQIKATGTYLGEAALEPWKVNRLQDILVFSLQFQTGLLFTAGYYIHGLMGGLLGGVLGALVNVLWINYIFPFLAYQIIRKKAGRSKNGRNSAFKLFIAAPGIIADTQEDFFARILTNRPASIGPAEIRGEDPTIDFVNKIAPKENRGDINLMFSLAHKKGEGRMGINQATYPRTALYGTNFIQGRPEIIDVVINVPQEENAAEEETRLMDNTIGILGMMIASKTIGVEMARVASFDGRLFNLTNTFSSAGVHTTQINPISEEVRKILDSGREIIEAREAQAKRFQASPAGDSAMNGGINMNSRLMRLKITGDTQNRIAFDDNAVSGTIINGVVPQVSSIVTVTPGMLKAMLGSGYLN